MAQHMACCSTLQLQLCVCLVLLFKTKGMEEKNPHTDVSGRVGGEHQNTHFLWFLF
jgi:hypothetical protein